GEGFAVFEIGDRVQDWLLSCGYHGRAAAPKIGETTSGRPGPGVWRANGETFTVSFAELLNYHGTTFPGGVAHGLKVMQRAFPL
ncbi:hypothetical protein, partial [Bacillus cereus group sp. Bce004]|uniref:hypothetical protein n=1 Tax=Bacillus cereus group sp. Bce004 TaxID=3445257 RepID=UPI003F27BBEF